METINPVFTAAYFVFGGIFLFLAFSVMRDNLSNRLNRITGLMLFFAALGPILLAFAAIVRPNVSAEAPFEESILYNMLYTWELFFPAFLLFSMAFPVDRLSEMKWPKLRYLIFLPQIFHLLLVVVFSDPDKILNLLDVESGEGFASLIIEPLSYVLKWVVLGFTLILSSEVTLFSTINIIYVIVGLYFINRGRGQIRNVELKRQSTIFIWGVSFAVGLYTLGFLIPRMFSIEISETLRTTILFLSLTVGGGSVIWSIIRYQFLDVTVLVRQSLVYTITSGILVGLYILIVSRANRWLTSMFGEQTAVANIAFIVVALILFQPINIRLDNLIKRFFIKRSSDYRNILEQLSRRLISVLDPVQLRNMIEKTLRTTILVDKVYFVLFDDKLDDYVLLSSEDYPDRVVIDRNDIFLGGVGQLDASTMINRLGLYRHGSILSDEMEKRRVQLILPLKDAEHLLGFLALTEKVSGYRYNAEDRTMLGVISNQLVTVLTNARLYIDSLEKQKLDEEMAMARQIQLDLLPKRPPSSSSCTISAFSIPSRTIGGDFYDFILKKDDTFGMVIADASGKGLPAALMVAQVQAMLRAEIDNENSISNILGNVNRHITELTGVEKYATLFYGEYCSKSGQFRYSNAGHNHPILIRADGSYELLIKGGTIIGAFSDAQFEDEATVLNHDDLLFLYTDGLSEAMNKNEEEYGQERIINYLMDKRAWDTNQIIEGILNDVRQFDPTYPPQDDTTIIVLKVTRGL